MISIDMPAGPSEVLVIADKYANPVHIAADLLSQVLPNLKLLLISNCLYASFTFLNLELPCWCLHCHKTIFIKYARIFNGLISSFKMFSNIGM